MIKVALLGCKSGAMTTLWCVYSLHISFPVSIISCVSIRYRCTLKTQEFRTKDFVVRWTRSIEHQKCKYCVGRQGRALTKTFIHIPFVGTPFGFMISFGEWALRERCSRHPSSKRYHEWCRSITVPTKEKHKKHKAALQQDIQQVTSYG